MASGTVSLSLGTAREETISLIVLYSAQNAVAQHGQLHVNNIQVMHGWTSLGRSRVANVLDPQVGTSTQLRPMESRTLFTDSLIKFTLAYPPTVKHDFTLEKYAPAVGLFISKSQPGGHVESTAVPFRMCSVNVTLRLRNSSAFYPCDVTVELLPPQSQRYTTGTRPQRQAPRYISHEPGSLLCCSAYPNARDTSQFLWVKRTKFILPLATEEEKEIGMSDRAALF